MTGPATRQINIHTSNQDKAKCTGYPNSQIRIATVIADLTPTNSPIETV